jgi:hypothetical protein
MASYYFFAIKNPNDQKRVLMDMLKLAFYSDSKEERNKYLARVIDLVRIYPQDNEDYLLKQVENIASIPDSLGLDDRITYNAEHSLDGDMLYGRKYSYVPIYEEPKEPDDPKDPNDPVNHGDMPDRYYYYYDPLVIDLNRDGTVNTTQDKRYFDLDADGLIEQTAWAAPGEGILVLDRDGDGRITSGRELFGDRTVMSNGKVATSGFQALSDLDSNGDGIIDSNDAMFSELRVWADKDEDGVFGDEELFTLEELGIKSININNIQQNTVNVDGNQIVRSGSVTWEDGGTSPISEFLLNRDQRNTIEPEPLPVPDDISKLPDLASRGYLYSLHQAMTHDESGELKSLVEQFTVEADPAARRAILDQMLLKWSAVSDIATSRNTGYREFLDKYFGKLTNPGVNLTNDETTWLQREYEAAVQNLYSSLLEQTHYADLINLCGLSFENDNLSLDISLALEEIAKGCGEDPDMAKQSITEFFLVLRTSRLYRLLSENVAQENAEMLSSYGEDLAEICQAAYIMTQYPVGYYALPKYSTEDGDALSGSAIFDILAGLGGNDTLDGGLGDDILIGGKGDDALRGGAGSDIYIWNPGDGSDVITDQASGSDANVLKFGAGVNPENVEIRRGGANLILLMKDTRESVTVANWFSNSSYKFSQVEFTDGTIWKTDLIDRQAQSIIDGTDGNDTIVGSSGDDILMGGKGDDSLSGGTGNDVYVWNLGDGNDTVNDYRSSKDYYKETGVIKFGEGVSPENMELKRIGNDAVFIVGETGEQIIVQNWYYSARITSSLA